MELLSLSPFRSGSVTWQPRPLANALTVVCKATFDLVPGECVLAAVQEPLHAADQHAGDDPKHRVYAPADLLPSKPVCDVTIVGHAFAPRGEPAIKLIARMAVGLVEKEIELWTGHDGAPMACASLEPHGVGPLAAGAPSRLAKLRARSPDIAERWRDDPLPSDFDFGFFNSAPADQQVTSLRADEKLVLHGLNADHPFLSTSLPGIHPRALVQRADGMTTELVMVPDSLWIETDRAICTLTWRAQIELDRPDEEGRVVIAAERAGERLDFSDILRLAGPIRRRESSRPSRPPPDSEAEPAVTLRRRAGTLLMMEGKPQNDASPAWLAPAPPPPVPSSFAEASARSTPLATQISAGTDLVRSSQCTALAATPADPITLLEAHRPKSDHFPRLARVPDPAAADPIELLWLEPSSVSAIRARFGEAEAFPEPDDEEARRDRLESDVVRALTSHAPIDARGVERAMSAVVGRDRRFRAPLVLVAGELRLSLEAIDGIATERVLLEHRRYQKRLLFGGTWIRAMLNEGDAGGGMVAYLPAAIATTLPMMSRLDVRLIGEARPKQDDGETERIAIKVVALGRVLKI